MRYCKTCNKPIPSGRSLKAKFCSDECSTTFWRDVARERGRLKAKAIAIGHTCPVCEITFIGPPERVYCSLQCRTKNKKIQTYQTRTFHLGDTRTCKHCGSTFTANTHSHIYCKHCGIVQNRQQKAKYCRKRKAILARVTIEEFTEREIYERDNYICGICGEQIDITKPYPDLESASIDHIISLSKGGNHTKDNVQAAHLVCNIRKGNRW